jgi:adenosine deaminase
MTGPASIWGAISALGAERIAHGVRAIEDRILIDYLVQHHIPLDITPTSNILLGVCPSYQTHPLSQLHKAGVTVTISTDDPPLFNTTLNQEIALLTSQFNLSIGELDEILLNGIRCSFLLERQRQDLEEEFRLELAALKAKYLADKDN